MPKATGATPQEGFGPELPGRDPVGRATTMSSRKDAKASAQKATAGSGDGAAKEDGPYASKARATR